ncbi:CDP-diacylglycerol diphosphatase [Pantoea stewartii]|uniref:CDP-diacylglycerol diphosphatase n=1 Tax=Pantoea stewartii TaxID=66269 RepID=UPI0002FF0F84
MRDIYALSREDANENSQGKITMQANRRAFIIIALLLVLIGAGILVAATHVKTNADALWQIVSEKCLPDQLTHGQPAPCQRVDLQHRYALLKDRNGPLQYLLIPIDKITGIESPQLLRSDTPNYFDLAWPGLAWPGLAWPGRTEASWRKNMASPSKTVCCHWPSIPSTAVPRISFIFIFHAFGLM